MMLTNSNKLSDSKIDTSNIPNTRKQESLFIEIKTRSRIIANKVFYSNDLQKQYCYIQNKMLLAHILSGCDSTSVIFRKGKLKIMKIMEKYQIIITKITETFKNIDATFSQIEKAGVTIYSII